MRPCGLLTRPAPAAAARPNATRPMSDAATSRPAAGWLADGAGTAVSMTFSFVAQVVVQPSQREGRSGMRQARDRGCGYPHRYRFACISVFGFEDNLDETETEMLLWIVFLLLVLLAIGGGFAVSNLLWLLLVVALVVAIFAMASGRRGAL